MNVAQEIRLGAVLEGPDDRRSVCGLVDRLIIENVDWIQGLDEHMDKVRTWIGVDERSTYLAWRDVAREARGRVPPRHGHFSGEPGVEDAHSAVLALRLFNTLPARPLGVVLVRDSDGKREERRKGLIQARDDARWPFNVVVGVAHHMGEAWVLAGFLPETPAEQNKLDQERQKLGFYPDREPHRLDAKNKIAVMSAKRVLDELTDEDHEREERCWKGAPLEVLRKHGADAQLDAFLGEVQGLLIPAIR